MMKYAIIVLLLLGVISYGSQDDQILMALNVDISQHDKLIIKTAVNKWFGSDLSDVKYSFMRWTKNSKTYYVTFFWEHQLNKDGDLTQDKLDTWKSNKTWDDATHVQLLVKENPWDYIWDLNWRPEGCL